MTSGCLVWIADLLARELSIAGAVLEIGSLDVNGTVRPLFADRDRFPEYTGVDMREGPGVDQLARGDDLPFADGDFDVVLAIEMLEHDSRFWATLGESWRVLRPDGWIIVTTRAFEFPRHDHPHDYWRFSAEGAREALHWAGFAEVEVVEDHEDLGVFARARRGTRGDARHLPAPTSLRLLPEVEVEILRARMRALIPLGITSLADAFERVDSDRRLLLRLAQAMVRDLSKDGTISADLASEIRALMGMGGVEDAREEDLQGMPVG